MSGRIIDHAKDVDASVSRRCTVVTSSGEKTQKDAEIVCEKYITVSVNGKQTFYISCTPDKLAELITGRLYTEKLIKSIDEIKSLVISGTHSCYIRFGSGEILSFEDISRHNATDKAVGAMLLKGEKPDQQGGSDRRSVKAGTGKGADPDLQGMAGFVYGL